MRFIWLDKWWNCFHCLHLFSSLPLNNLPVVRVQANFRFFGRQGRYSFLFFFMPSCPSARVNSIWWAFPTSLIPCFLFLSNQAQLYWNFQRKKLPRLSFLKPDSVPTPCLFSQDAVEPCGCINSLMLPRGMIALCLCSEKSWSKVFRSIVKFVLKVLYWKTNRQEFG